MEVLDFSTNLVENVINLINVLFEPSVSC